MLGQYVAEMRAEKNLSSTTKRILRTIEIRMLRAIREVNLKNKIRNQQIRQDYPKHSKMA